MMKCVYVNMYKVQGIIIDLGSELDPSYSLVTVLEDL